MLPYIGTTLSVSNNTFKWEFSALGLFELWVKTLEEIKVCMPIYFTYFVDVFGRNT